MEKPVPYNINAERAVLGAILLDRDAILSARKHVGIDEFYLQKHGQIYDAALRCLDRRIPPDIVSVGEELRKADQLEIIGGMSFLGELLSEVATAVHVDHYAKIVSKLAARRRLIETGGRISAMGYDESDDVERKIHEAEQMLQLERRVASGDERWQLTAKDGSNIWRQHYERRPFVVEEFLPEGTTLLHGKPKTKKSWAALNISYAVASGGKAFGHFQALKGEVLYIDLEMSEDIINERLRTVFPDQAPPKGVTFVTDWPRVGEGFEEQLAGFLDARPFTRLIVVDTLVRVRKGRNGGADMYEHDAHTVQPLTRFCNEHPGVSMLLIHHSRKADGLDAVDTASGSTGLTGSVDNVIALKRKEEKGRAELLLEGRRIKRDDDIPLKWDAMLAQWNYEDTAPKISPERRMALRFLTDRPGITSNELAVLMNRTRPSTSRLLSEMKSAELVENLNGGWFATADLEPLIA